MSYAVLIVDDSATTRALIQRTLKLAEIPLAATYEASNGNEALELMDCLKVDLVLADLNMPHMSGFELTRRMIAHPAMSRIPVIVVSAEPNAQEFACRHPLIRGVIRKPFTPEGVRNLVSEILGAVHA